MSQMVCFTARPDSVFESGPVDGHRMRWADLSFNLCYLFRKLGQLSEVSHSLDSVVSFNTFVHCGSCKLDVGFKARSDSGSGVFFVCFFGFFL